MANVHAFRGIRYDLGHVGELSNVVAPPYDVIGTEFQTKLYDQHPANIIRLILNREEPGDDENSNRYSRAARLFRNWRGEGLLQTEPDPAIYAYHQKFSFAGVDYLRRGFMARVRLETFGEGNIFPHEETHSAAKADRLQLIKACRANLSQIFGIYPDAENIAQECLEEEIIDVVPLEAVDHIGVKHQIWPVTNGDSIMAVSSAMAEMPIFIADGHHRYETACNYREYLSAEGKLTDNHPANSVLMMCVSMYDPGMIVLPTHRLFRGLPPLSSDELIQRMGDNFSTRIAGEGLDLAESIWELIEDEDSQGTLGLYTAKDERWVIAKITQAGYRRLAEVSPEQSPEWRSLGVSILHRLLVETLLDARDLPTPEYVHQVEEVANCLENQQENATFPLTALVMPATLEDIRAISQLGERMPAKSTYFFPKLLSGLVINPVDQD